MELDKKRLRVTILVMVTMFIICAAPTPVLAEQFIGQFAGYAGIDDGTIDNCRFEDNLDSGEDWVLEDVYSHYRSSNEHQNTYSHYFYNKYYDSVIFWQKIDDDDLQDLKDAVGGDPYVIFNFWFDALDNEEAKACIMLKKSGTWYYYYGGWTPASAQSGDLKWAQAESSRVRITSNVEEMRVRILVRDPDNQYTSVYIDDARLVIHDYKYKYGSYGDFRIDMMYETCRDYAGDNSWNELVYSIALSAEADPGYKIKKMEINMEMHPLAGWPFFYYADCDAEIQVMRKAELSNYLYFPGCPGLSDSGGGFDLDIKAMKWGLKSLTALAKTALGIKSLAGGILFSIGAGEVFDYLLNTIYDDGSAQGHVVNEYWTKTSWWYGGPYEGITYMPSIASCSNQVSFRWDRSPAQDINVYLFGRITWIKETWPYTEYSEFVLQFLSTSLT
ncbi:MAG: hypothetical protein RTU30_11665 [Candidatus Thorarchaeota archaeon]